MARTFALIAPVWRVLLHVSCWSETVPNAPKWKETHQNMSWGSNGVDRECLLRKLLTRHHGTNFGINCASLTRFASSLCSSIMVPNAAKWKEIHENMSLGANCVDRERPFREILTRLCGTNSCINFTRLPICTEFRAVAKRFQMHPNRKKRTKKWI